MSEPCFGVPKMETFVYVCRSSLEMFAGELNTIFPLDLCSLGSREAHYCYPDVNKNPLYAGPAKTAPVLCANRLQVMKCRSEKHDCGRLAASFRACEHSVGTAARTRSVKCTLAKKTWVSFLLPSGQCCALNSKELVTKQTLDRENVSEGCTISKLRNYILLTSLE